MPYHPPRRVLAAIPLLLAALNASPSLTARQPQAPRTLAFVAGIEHYDDTELDKLQFAADDARKVFEQLKIVADLDPGSVLLVADDNETDPAKHRVEGDRLRTELQKFVQLITDDMNVVVYLGGHGTSSPAKTLLYLPSDYDRQNKLKYVPFSEIQGMFDTSINGQLLKNVTLTFLVNMCGAGNAVSSDRVAMNAEDRELDNVLRQMARDDKFGMKHYALIPAAGKDRNTFEDAKLGASLFGHALIEALGGRAAAGGTITTGSLFKYISATLQEDLPRNANFDFNITIGVTRRVEAEAEYLVGSALLASTRALEDGDGSRERVDHQRALLDLAQEELDLAAQHSIDLAGRATLRRAQASMLANRSVSGVALPRGASLQPEEAKQLKSLTDRSATVGPAGLRELRNQLQAGEPFYAAIVDTRGGRPVDQQSDGAADAWSSVLNGFPGHKAVAQFQISNAIDVARPAGLPVNLLPTVRNWAAAEPGASRPARLFLVYTGVSTTPSLDTRPPKPLSDSGPAERLLPFGRDEIGQVVSLWKGPVTVCYLAPFGGELLKTAAPPGAVSLLLAAQERRGMTFAGWPTQPSNVSLLARALQEGVEQLEDWAPLSTFIRESAARFRLDDRFVVGTPRFVPEWGTADSRPLLDGQLGPLRRFALHVAHGCALERLESCDVGANGDPFDLLAAAGEKDLSDQRTAALPLYTDAAKRLRAEAAFTSAGPGAAETREALGRLADRVDERIKGRTTPQGRKVVLLRLGVHDYTNPLIADLPDPSGDLEAYSRAMSQTLGPANNPVVVLPVKVPSTAAEVKSEIAAARDTLGPDDLLVLVYSGRGAEIGGRRYISPSGVKTCFEEGVPNCSPNGTWTELVDLWDVAELMAGHSFVAIYDAQFTPPTGLKRFDAVLDKQLDSARAAPFDPYALPPKPVRTQPTATLDVRPAGSLPPHQLHLWLEGPLTAQTFRMRCTGPEPSALVSPLAAAITSRLPPKSPATYRQWLQDVAGHECLFGQGEELRTLAAQGDVDLALFASGGGAELVDYFRNDDARREMNLIAAANVTKAVLERFPTPANRLARASVLLAAGTHLTSTFGRMPAEPAPGRIPAAEWLTAAGTLLDEARASAEAADPATSLLPSLWRELSARRLVLAGDPARARAEIGDAPPAVLAERNLARRFVELTEEAALRQPATLLQETSDVLELARRSLSGTAAETVAGARQTAMILAARQESRSLARFTIGPPPSARER